MSEDLEGRARPGETPGTTADLLTEVSAELAARRGLSTGIDDLPAVRRPLDAALAEAPGPFMNGRLPGLY